MTQHQKRCWDDNTQKPTILSAEKVSYFAYLVPVMHLRGGFAEMGSESQSLTITRRKLHLRCMANFWIHFLIELICCVIISIIIHFTLIYFAILLFRCFILIASSELFPVIISASFLVFCNFAAYFGKIFLYLISFLPYPLNYLMLSITITGFE